MSAVLVVPENSFLLSVMRVTTTEHHECDYYGLMSVTTTQGTGLSRSAK